MLSYTSFTLGEVTRDRRRERVGRSSSNVALQIMPEPIRSGRYFSLDCSPKQGPARLAETDQGRGRSGDGAGHPPAYRAGPWLRPRVGARPMIPPTDPPARPPLSAYTM